MIYIVREFSMANTTHITCFNVFGVIRPNVIPQNTNIIMNAESYTITKHGIIEYYFFLYYLV